MPGAARKALIPAAQLATVAVLLLLWQGVSSNEATSFSRPSQVAKAIGTWLTSAPLRTDIYTTLGETVIGMAIAIAVAILLAAALTASQTVARTVDPFVAVLNAIPKVALAPLFLLVFGIGFSAKVYFVVAAVFFIPFFSLYRALRTIDRDHLDNIRALGASRGWLIWDVYVPAVVGSTIASLRVASAFAVVSAVIAELVTTSSNGIGLEILQAQSNAQPDYMVAGVLIVSAIAFAFDRVFRVIELRFDTWRIAS
jgi:NitT/TauT family transport system permease protein